jgi:hypothetical protein
MFENWRFLILVEHKNLRKKSFCKISIKNLPWLCFYFKSIYIHVQSSFRSEIFVKDCLQEYMFDMQILQGKCVRRNKTALGLRDRLRLLSKLRIWGPIKPLVNAQPEFRTLSEFYIIIFLNKLKIVENELKKIFKKSKKRLRLKLWDPSDVQAEPPLIGPVDKTHPNILMALEQHGNRRTKRNTDGK